MTSFYPFSKMVPAIALTLTCCVLPLVAQTGTTPPADAAAKLEPAKAANAASTKTVKPYVHSIRDVELGMSIEDVKKKLGKPDVQDDTGLLFTLAGGDSVQIGLDDKKQVRTVAVIYAAGSKSAPALRDIFGADVDDASGDTYKMERYPDAGYWVSYSRSNSQDKPLVVVTMRKIQ